MNHESFQAAIRASPDDDTSRLVYADWLDDQGDSTRAEFIRVQTHLQHLDDDDPQRPTLEVRQRELLEANESRWLGSVPPCVVDWSFRGGFVERVRLSSRTQSDWALDDFFAMHPIREVTGLAGPCAHRFFGLRHLDTVSRLKLRGSLINQTLLAALADSSIRTIRSLNLNETALMDADVAALVRAPRLVGLDDLTITNGRVTPACLEALAAEGKRWRRLEVMVSSRPQSIALLGRCINLRRLGVHIDSDRPIRLPALPALQSVILATSRAPGSLSLLDPRMSWPASLRHLSVWTAGVDSEAEDNVLAAVLAGLPQPALELYVQTLMDGRPHPWTHGIGHSERITRLTVWNLGGVRGLCEESGLSELRYLRAKVSPAVRDRDLARMIRSPQWQRLTTLRLKTHSLGAESVRALVESPYLTRLRDLQLSGALTAECLELLGNWPGLCMLDRLKIHTRAPGTESSHALLHSPYLSPLTRFRANMPRLTEAARQVLRERLGRRFHG